MPPLLIYSRHSSMRSLLCSIAQDYTTNVLVYQEYRDVFDHLAALPPTLAIFDAQEDFPFPTLQDILQVYPWYLLHPHRFIVLCFSLPYIAPTLRAHMPALWLREIAKPFERTGHSPSAC